MIRRLIGSYSIGVRDKYPCRAWSFPIAGPEVVVIPAKAGIQYFLWIPGRPRLKAGVARNDNLIPGTVNPVLFTAASAL